MPVIYETTANIAENGHLLIDVGDLPFAKGTQFLVKLIPQTPYDIDVFQQQMQALIDDCARNTPYRGKSNDEILIELRQQRENICNEPL